MSRAANLLGVDKKKLEVCTRRFEIEQKALKRRRLAKMKGNFSRLVQSTLKFKQNR